jgi:regulation of enolase protein 1 (concanavalin A-like superfamily)
VNRVDWSAGRWTHDPEVVDLAGDALTVIAAEGSDAWRRTGYGFVHDSEHALLAPIGVGEAMEVTFAAGWEGEFDQAGMFIRIDDHRWVKAGLEYADGHLGLGAVVTDGTSDWSVGHVDEWAAAAVTVRVSRWPDALIIRARAAGGQWRLVRVAPFDGGSDAAAGPFLCAPTRSGFSAAFTAWSRGTADEAIH